MSLGRMVGPSGSNVQARADSACQASPECGAERESAQSGSDMCRLPAPPRTPTSGCATRDAAQFRERSTTMKASTRAELERRLLEERERLQGDLARLDSQPRETEDDRGRFADEAVAGTAGASVEVDRALGWHTARELGDVELALQLLRDDPEQFGLCATCKRPISLERLRLVPSARYCRIHAQS
jgi:RNA polymerase-binding transcription factor DksA